MYKFRTIKSASVRFYCETPNSVFQASTLVGHTSVCTVRFRPLLFYLELRSTIVMKVPVKVIESLFKTNKTLCWKHILSSTLLCTFIDIRTTREHFLPYTFTCTMKLIKVSAIIINYVSGTDSELTMHLKWKYSRTGLKDKMASRACTVKSCRFGSTNWCTTQWKIFESRRQASSFIDFVQKSK